mgnify:CR=1 FL=1
MHAPYQATDPAGRRFDSRQGWLFRRMACHLTLTPQGSGPIFFFPSAGNTSVTIPADSLTNGQNFFLNGSYSAAQVLSAAARTFSYVNASQAGVTTTFTQTLVNSTMIVPEPGTVGLGLLGLGAVAWIGRRTRRRASLDKARARSGAV